MIWSFASSLRDRFAMSGPLKILVCEDVSLPVKQGIQNAKRPPGTRGIPWRNASCGQQPYASDDIPTASFLGYPRAWAALLEATERGADIGAGVRDVNLTSRAFLRGLIRNAATRFAAQSPPSILEKRLSR
ncbi:hypothetical protein [Novosphingobium sp. PhB165]|uniref:hypothetical protein n=1 Tax=Novosphingobium sp. PhB165 TaxID=2485105 RepID=UPI0010475395|nr:hypothetical protein [Novosphingobium sp. PhB165]